VVVGNPGEGANKALVTLFYTVQSAHRQQIEAPVDSGSVGLGTMLGHRHGIGNDFNAVSQRGGIAGNEVGHLHGDAVSQVQHSEAQPALREAALKVIHGSATIRRTPASLAAA
jgi:hypothetical protein